MKKLILGIISAAVSLFLVWLGIFIIILPLAGAIGAESLLEPFIIIFIIPGLSLIAAALWIVSKYIRWISKKKELYEQKTQKRKSPLLISTLFFAGAFGILILFFSIGFLGESRFFQGLPAWGEYPPTEKMTRLADTIEEYPFGEERKVEQERRSCGGWSLQRLFFMAGCTSPMIRIQFTTTDSEEDVRSFYTDALIRNGWKDDSPTKGHSFKKEGCDLLLFYYPVTLPNEPNQGELKLYCREYDSD